MLAASEHQLFLQSRGDGALPAAAEARHPQGRSLLAHRGVALLAGQVAGLAAESIYPDRRELLETLGIVYVCVCIY